MCAFTFAPSLTPQALRTLYARGYHGPHDDAPPDGWAVDLSFLEPVWQLARHPPPWRVLDFGAGASLAPDLLRARGHRVIEVDLAPPAKPHPDRLTGDLLSLTLPRRQFELVYSYQVFEHLAEPWPVLEELLSLTREHGLLLIHTDMEMPEREAGLSDWWYVMPPDHCAFYRHRTFRHVLRDGPHHVVWADPKRMVIRAWNDRA